MGETRAELPFTGDQVGLFRAQPGRPKQTPTSSQRAVFVNHDEPHLAAIEEILFVLTDRLADCRITVRRQRVLISRPIGKPEFGDDIEIWRTHPIWNNRAVEVEKTALIFLNFREKLADQRDMLRFVILYEVVAGKTRFLTQQGNHFEHKNTSRSVMCRRRGDI